MLRIGVISDTHGNLTFASKALNLWGKVDCILHAGDGYRDALALAKMAGCPVYAVCGNTDGVFSPTEELVDLQDLTEEDLKVHKILLTHGHEFSPATREVRLADLAKRRGSTDSSLRPHPSTLQQLPLGNSGFQSRKPV